MFSQEAVKEIYGVETLYRELGYFLYGKQQYRKSLPPLTKATEVSPTNLRARLGRAWSRAKTAYYTCAINDIDIALATSPKDLRAIQLKAHFTFLRTDFEDAFVQNQRGIPKRKMPNGFLIGAMQCAEEVERTIGKRGGHALRDYFDIIRIIAWKKALDLRKGRQWKPRNRKRRRKPKKTDNTPQVYINQIKKHKALEANPSDISILESLTEDKTHELFNQLPKNKSSHQPQQRRTTNIDNLIAEKYLEKMAYDKKYLKGLKTDPNIMSPNKEGSEQIKLLVRKGYKDVSFRQEILRIRQPFYSIKYNEVHATGQLLRRKMDELDKLQQIAKKDTELLIKQLKVAKELHQTNTCLRIANKCKYFIDKKPLKIMPNKEKYLKQLYNLIADVYLEVFKLKDTMTYSEMERRINFIFGLPIGRIPSTDSVIQANKKEFEDIKKSIEKTEIRMSKASTPLETVWLFYDLARLNLEQKKWDLSRFYARKSLNMAMILQHYVWATNVSMLVAKTHVLQKNKNEAQTELGKAKDVAKSLKNTDILAYIDLCMEVVEQVDFEEICASKVIKKREYQILRTVVDLEIQEEIKHLFIKMNAVPPSRRMSIMPGIPHILKDSKAHGATSIKPKSAVELELQRQLKKKGLELLDVD